MHQALDGHRRRLRRYPQYFRHQHRHVQLEAELAELHGKQAALLFNSGYLANEAALSTPGRARRRRVILSDELNHASMIDGIRHAPLAPRSSGATMIFDDLEARCRPLPIGAPKLIAFELVYSMDGDIAPIAEICDLARRYGALTYLDEVHAVGIYGPRGGGIAERDGVPGRVDHHRRHARQGFRRHGRLYRGSAALHRLRSASHAPGFIFTTSLAPVLAAGALASVRHLKTSGAERAAQQRNAALLKRMLEERGLPVLALGSGIVPVLIGDAVSARP